jgi:tetratricopeptide (TPR) repeat protein
MPTYAIGSIRNGSIKNGFSGQQPVNADCDDRIDRRLPDQGFFPLRRLIPKSIGPPPVLEDRSAAAIHYERLAIENFQRGELESSLELIGLGLNAAPNDNGLLALRNRIQNYQQAIQLLAKARERQQQGTLDESLKLIEQGLQLVPEQPDLLKLRDQLEVRAKLEQIANQYADWANDALAQGDLKKAEDYLAQLSQIKPDHPKLSILRAGFAGEAGPRSSTAIQRQIEEAPRQQMDEELKRRMEAEAKRKTEEEVKRQAVEEAKRKAAERARRQVAEQPKQQTATPDAGGNNHRRCGDILSRLTLGEPVPDEDRTFLRRCR